MLPSSSHVEIGKACENKPVKYSRSYGDKLVSMAIEALQLCETANTIWMKGKVRKDDYELRRQNFQKARGLIATIGIVFGIYMLS